MASTYSTNLKIELQATGENSGTWGTITNTNLGTALEQAIVGYGNPNYASDANLTLTYTDTNAAQAARALVLNVTSGVSLTGTRELVVPTIQKQYIVQNNTTGSQSITVKTSAGTGITVPNGRKAHLYVNGTDVIYMDDYVDINGGAIDGTPIGANSASTGAFTTLSASSGATLSGGNLTFSSTAQRITGDFSNATASNRLAFQSSTTNGNTNIEILPNGTATRSDLLLNNSSDPANSSLAQVFISNTEMRILSSQRGTGSSLPMTFYTGGSERARIDTSGNVGIGTASPAQIVEASKSQDAKTQIKITNVNAGANASAGVLFGTSSGDNGYVGANGGAASSALGGANALQVTNLASAPVVIATNNTERMRIDGSTGNVGVGGTAGADTKVLISGTLPTSGTVTRAVLINGTIPSGSTGAVVGFNSPMSTQAASFTLGNLTHFSASQGTIGSGSAITNQYGFSVDSGLTGATNNFGFYSNIASGSNRWNFYAAGTARNYFAGGVEDSYGNVRAIPPVGTKTSSYTLATTDVGRYVQVGTSGSITIPDATFAEGDVVSIFNNTTGNITITCTITTAYIAGTDADKASVTLATRGVATILFISSTVCVISGNVS